ncbi:hypothetical protein ACLB2K_019184 [Fragaria x ananassa]
MPVEVNDWRSSDSATVPTHKVTIHDRQCSVVHEFFVSEDQYILHTTEAQDISLPFACRHGCCTSCVVRVKSGKLNQPQALGISAELKSQLTSLLALRIPPWQSPGCYTSSFRRWISSLAFTSNGRNDDGLRCVSLEDPNHTWDPSLALRQEIGPSLVVTQFVVGGIEVWVLSPNSEVAVHDGGRRWHRNGWFQEHGSTGLGVVIQVRSSFGFWSKVWVWNPSGPCGLWYWNPLLFALGNTTLPTAWSRRHKPKSSGKKDGTPPQSTPKTSNSASTVESNRQHLLDGGLHEKLQSRFEDHDDGERNGRRRWDDAAQGFQLEGESGEVRFESQYVGFLTGDEAVGGGGQAIQ